MEAVAEKVLEYVAAKDHVTFVEIERVVRGEGVDTEGDLAPEVPGCPNLEHCTPACFRVRGAGGA